MCYTNYDHYIRYSILAAVNVCSNCQTANVEEAESLCSKCQPTLICTYCGRTSPEEVCRQCSNTYCQYRTNPRDFSYSADTTQIDSSRSLIHDPSNDPGLAENTPTVLDRNCVVCNPELIADGNQYICSVCAGGHEVTTEFRSQSLSLLSLLKVPPLQNINTS